MLGNYINYRFEKEIIWGTFVIVNISVNNIRNKLAPYSSQQIFVQNMIASDQPDLKVRRIEIDSIRSQTQNSVTYYRLSKLLLADRHFGPKTLWHQDSPALLDCADTAEQTA